MRPQAGLGVAEKPGDHLLRGLQRLADDLQSAVRVAGLEGPLGRGQPLHDAVVELDRLAGAAGSSGLAPGPRLGPDEPVDGVAQQPPEQEQRQRAPAVRPKATATSATGRQ